MSPSKEELEAARKWAREHPEFGYDREDTLLGRKSEPDKERDRNIGYDYEDEDQAMRLIYAPAVRKRGNKGHEDWGDGDDRIEAGGRQVDNRARAEEWNQRTAEHTQSAEDAYYAREAFREKQGKPDDFYHAWTYLEPKHQAVLDMRLVAGWSFADIARELGMEESAVRKGRGRYPRAVQAWLRVYSDHAHHGKPEECPDGPYDRKVVVPKPER